MSDDEDGVDWVERLRLDPIDRAETKPAAPKRAKLKDGFVRLPMAWATRLGKARHVATWKLAACVLFLDWKGGGEPVTLSNVVLNEWGLPQGRTKRKALAELEALGLVSVERRAKRSPLIKRKI